ncbi:CotS family spore coat protein [Alkalihalobacillus hemicellulosilyticus]|uniref:Spore coat protein S n=1 Tax=Halalkalibacter hemicellulosilyticusJCM 9152 TaxID=1236971 RepID=W4QHS5_9BACI|nr:CotS family spore coat protein [Halalkalibacter hemicellulosilyticus]GAE31651.1 spore coat protein S [Halalkalibacter hemicellulosilyticusJCM 9152]
MQEELITPWDEDETLGDFFVPAYIEEMAQEVITHYDMTVSNMVVITTKADKGGLIWKIDTNHGPRSLKILHRRPARSLFSLGAQEYLVKEKEARVPPIIKTTSGENFVEKGGKLWFVAEWIEPLYQVTKDIEGAKLLCHALGEFHSLSKGYIPPAGAENPSRLNRWPKSYQKVIRKMDWFKNIAHAYPEMPASATILSVTDLFEEQAKKAYERLTQSNYYELITRGNQEWGLVHQDYGWSNGQMGPGGMWVIDLDGVAYDLPIRDLRKLITGTMDDLGTWDVTWMLEMINAYHEANPIENDLFELLLIDMSLPNEYYKNVKELVYEPELFMDSELDSLCTRIVQTDESKWPAIDELQSAWKGASSS